MHVEGGENAYSNQVCQASLLRVGIVAMHMVSMRRGTMLVPYAYYGFGRVL